MLLYVENKAYPLKTLVVLCQPTDTVARVRAQLLHSLYEIGHSNHQFRLWHQGSYLRDAYTLEEYKILNNAIITMIPLNDISQWNKDMRFHQSDKKQEKEVEVEDLVQVALKSEIRLLETRERVLGVFKTALMMQIILVFLAAFTLYWYFIFAYLVFLCAAFIYCPSFTRIGGWVGKNSVRRKEFMIVFGVLTLCMLGAGIALFTLIVIDLKSSAYPTIRCTQKVESCFENAIDTIEEGICFSYQRQCYETSVWTAVYFCMEIFVMLITSVLCWILLHNFKFEVGDEIERFLVQTREIHQILDAAKHGTNSKKRNAAFELATMASSGDDNKFHIVGEGGLEVLITLGLSSDSTTQEYATEAIAECLTVPAIQDQFVLVGGMRMLTALLNAKNQRTVKEAITAISYVVIDSDDNKLAVVADHGLEDLLYACKYANTSSRKILASIYLELADHDDTRVVLTSRTSTMEALLKLLTRSTDEDTLAMTLQTLELLTIEAPTLVTSQEELMKYLLLFPSKTLDKKLQYLAAKLLLCFAESPESCEIMVSQPDVVDNLLYFARSSDQAMQKTLANIAFRMSEIPPYRERLQSEGLVELLAYIQNSANDRETWNMADQAVVNLQGTSSGKLDLKSTMEQPSPASSVFSLDHDDDGEASFAYMGPRQRTNMSVQSNASNVPGPSGLTSVVQDA